MSLTKLAPRVVAGLCCLSALIAAPRSVPPKLVLWSWYGEDDLRFLKGSDTGVAYLALSLRFEGRDEVIPSPREMPLRTAPNTWLMPVIRFDFEAYDARLKPAFSERQRQLAARMIAEIASVAHAQAIQIDFDAPQSAYPFYRQLLQEVRRRLGPNVFLSMTALVSWCETPKSWLSALPVDEIVPMAFYMGQATPAITTKLARGGTFAYPGCRNSIGVQLETGTAVRFGVWRGDGESVKPRKNQRAYFFAQPSRWSLKTVRLAQEAILP